MTQFLGQAKSLLNFTTWKALCSTWLIKITDSHQKTWNLNTFNYIARISIFNKSHRQTSDRMIERPYEVKKSWIEIWRMAQVFGSGLLLIVRMNTDEFARKTLCSTKITDHHYKIWNFEYFYHIGVIIFFKITPKDGMTKQ